MIYKFYNNGKTLLFTQINSDSTNIFAILPGRYIYADSENEKYVAKQLTKSDETFTSEKEIRSIIQTQFQQTLQKEKEDYMKSLVQRVSKVLSSFILNDDQFTALDVTNAVKADGGSFLKHSEIKEVVDAILEVVLAQTSNYLKQLISVDTPNGIDKAYLYTPDSKDVSEYTKTDSVAIPPAKVTCPVHGTFKAVVITAPVPTIPEFCQRASHYAKVKVRKDGAIELPLKLLNDSEFLDGYADLNFHPNSLSLVVTDDFAGEINLSIGVRIRKNVLMRANLDGNDYLWVAAYKDKLVIAAE